MTSSAPLQRGPVRRSALRRARGPAGRGAAVLILTLPVLGAVGPAVAAPQQVSTGSLAHGTAVVTPCGALAAGAVSYRTTDGVVVAVTLTDLPPACDGAQVWLTLTNGTQPVASTGPLRVVSGAVTAVLSDGPDSGAVTSVHVAAVG